MADRSSKQQDALRQSPVMIKVKAGEKQREVVVKKEESFVKGYQTLHTFFESEEFKQICEQNAAHISK